MPVRTKVLIALLALSALLAAPAAASAAKPKTHTSVEPPSRRVEFKFRGSKGWRFEVDATIPAAGAAPKKKRSPNLPVFAHRGKADVQYLTYGHIASNGAIDARLPGVGRIAVNFEPTELTRSAFAENCRGRAAKVNHGYFRGTIELHGERGYTSVDRSSVPGKLIESFRQVCKGGGTYYGPGDARAQGLKTLLAGRTRGRLTLSLSVTEFEGSLLPGPPKVFFSATSTLHRQGMFVSSSVSTDGDPTNFSITPAEGTPESATVNPPSPFEGSAQLEIESPKTSTWFGDLAVGLPGVGKVALAGPDFWSGLCEGSACSGSLPSNLSFQVIS